MSDTPETAIQRLPLVQRKALFLHEALAEERKSAEGSVGDYYVGAAAEDKLDYVQAMVRVVDECQHGFAAGWGSAPCEAILDAIGAMFPDYTEA